MQLRKWILYKVLILNHYSEGFQNTNEYNIENKVVHLCADNSNCNFRVEKNKSLQCCQNE